jgi:hypothetical protein
MPFLAWVQLMSLTNHRLRNIHLPEVDALLEHLDSYRPSLQSSIQNVTLLLSLVIEDRCLPEQKLHLEMLTESQIASGEHAAQSLEELFKLTDEFSYFLAQNIHSDLPQSVTEGSPSPLVSPRKQGNTGISFSGPDAIVPMDVGITFSSVNTAFLSSPLNSPEITFQLTRNGLV